MNRQDLYRELCARIDGARFRIGSVRNHGIPPTRSNDDLILARQYLSESIQLLDQLTAEAERTTGDTNDS